MEISVWRGGLDGGAFRDYRVPAEDNQTILDVVSWIQENLDPELSYRFACRVGMCGSCAMMVNGEPRWTCRTHVRKVLRNNAIRIAPLHNLPFIKDLATDMDPFFDKWVRAEGAFHPSSNRDVDVERVRPETKQRRSVDVGIECINCGVRHAACDVVAANPDYLGPAALNRAWTLINDVRDGAPQSILDAVSTGGSCHNYHSMGNCAQYCPNVLSPMNAIAGLKRATSRSFLKGGG